MASYLHNKLRKHPRRELGVHEYRLRQKDIQTTRRRNAAKVGRIETSVSTVYSCGI
jgi:hypothetical protein